MKPQLQNNKLSWKTLTPLCLMVGYWFYNSISFGYFLSKIFYTILDTFHKNSLAKRGQLRKKLHLKNIIKNSIDFFWKLIQNWLIRIFEKFLLFISALDQSVQSIMIFRKRLKSLFKFQHNFRLLKYLLLVFWKTFLVFCSLVNEILFFNNLINWVIKWRHIIRSLMKESLFITTFVYFFYWILLGLFGVFLGFLLGLYRHKHKYETDQLYLFFLLLLFNILSKEGFDEILLGDLTDSSLAPNTSKFSFKPIPQMERRPFKMMLKESEQRPQIPFPISGDPVIDVDFMIEMIEEPINYQFQLFLLYPNTNQKVKS